MHYVVIPTYQEKKNIRTTVDAVLSLGEGYRVIVVDDASTDGTKDELAFLASQHVARCHVVHRLGPRSFARSYIEGFSYALAHEDCESVIECDADGSHPVSRIPDMVHALQEHDLAIGSRYVSGGDITGFQRSRLWLSRAANVYLRRMTNLAMADITAGFVAYRADLLRRMPYTMIRSNGYAFQIDMKWLASGATTRWKELPITFMDRSHGQSKMSFSTMIEAFIIGLRYRFKKRPSLNPRLLIAAGIYPPEVGGVSSVAHRVVEDLRGRGHEVLVITYGSMDAEERGAFGERVIRIARGHSVLGRYKRYAKALFQALTPNTRLLVLDALSVGLPARLACAFRSPQKLVFRFGGEALWERMVHAGRTSVSLRAYWEQSLGGWRQWLMKRYYHWLLAPADRIVLVSSLLEACFHTFFDPVDTRFSLLPNRLTLKNPSNPREVRRSEQPLRLLFVGRFVRVKNLTFLCHVLRRCFDEKIAFTCTFVGSGPDESAMKELLADIPHVSFVGDVPAHEIASYFSKSDLLLLPSTTDIYPNVVIEALACGVPVLLTKEHGLEKGFGGILELSPTDESSWVNALGCLEDEHAYGAFQAGVCIPPYVGVSIADELLREKF